jgi:hypothetical protein
MMRRTRLLAATFAATLVAAGCGETDDLSPGSDPDPAPSDEADHDADDEADGDEPADGEDAAEDPAEGDVEAADELEADEDDAEQAGWQYVEEFDEPHVWEENGLRLSVTGIGFNDATSDELPSEVAEFLEDDAQVVVVLEMTISNDTGETVDFFPSQGQIQLLREQVDADLWFSDNLAGTDWRDGVDDDGQVMWLLSRTGFDEAVAAGELAYTASGAFSAEDFDNVTSDVDMTIEWTTP